MTNGDAYLEILTGDEAGLELPLADAPVTLGRSPGNTHVVHDPAASRQHLKIFLRDGRRYVADMNSSHGTFVNDAQITLHELCDGDEIKLGKTVLRYALRVVAAPPPAPPEAEGFALELPDAAPPPAATEPDLRTPVPSVARAPLPPIAANYRRALTSEGEDPFAEEPAAPPTIEMRGRTAEQFAVRGSGRPVPAASPRVPTAHVPPPVGRPDRARGPFRFLRDELDQRGPVARASALLFTLGAAAGLFWLTMHLIAATPRPEAPADPDDATIAPVSNRPQLPPRR